MGNYLPVTEGLISGRLTRTKASREECARITGQTCLLLHISGGFHLGRSRHSGPGGPRLMARPRGSRGCCGAPGKFTRIPIGMWPSAIPALIACDRACMCSAAHVENADAGEQRSAMGRRVGELWPINWFTLFIVPTGQSQDQVTLGTFPVPAEGVVQTPDLQVLV